MAGWLRRMTPSFRGSGSTAPAAEAAAAAVAEADSAGVGSGKGGGDLRSPLKVASSTASIGQGRGLSAALEDLLPGTEEGSEAAAEQEQGSLALPSPRPPLPPGVPAPCPASPSPAALRPASPSPAALQRQRSGASGRASPAPPSPLLSRVEALREPAASIPLMLFPDTPEGQLAQVGLGVVADGGCRLAGMCTGAP